MICSSKRLPQSDVEVPPVESRDVGRIHRVTEVESYPSYWSVDLNPDPYRVIESGPQIGGIAKDVTYVVEKRSRKESHERKPQLQVSDQKGVPSQGDRPSIGIGFPERVDEYDLSCDGVPQERAG